MNRPTPASVADARYRLKYEIAHLVEHKYEDEPLGQSIEVDWHNNELYLTIHGLDMVFRIEPEFYTTLD